MNTNIKISIITIFPEIFNTLKYGVINRIITSQSIKIKTFNPREYCNNPRGYIDDSPYGGGPGMIMQAEPLINCMQAALKFHTNPKKILLTPRGIPVTQQLIQQDLPNEMILVCGRYEGIDQRFINTWIDMEISIGDFIMSGGEIPALAIIDAYIRTLPDGLGSELSAQDDSFSNNLLEFDQYTRPKIVNGQQIPKVLLSGNHAQIATWRKQQSLKLTLEKRPDLLDKADLKQHDIDFLKKLQSGLKKGDISD